ncbi:MAG: EamA family transporter RarD [Propionibacteriaceae bacterium]
MTSEPTPRSPRGGVAYALAAYGMWGLVPLFWPLVARAGAVEILAHRIIWTLVPAILLLLTVVPRDRFRQLLTARRIGLLTAAAVTIAVNWGVYIWAVNHAHIVDAALGYYINPILSILLGVVILHERLSRIQWAAVGLALAAVITLTIDYGRPPWIALTLAVSFATYGFLKKTVDGGAIETLTIESALLLLPAVGYLVWLNAHGAMTFIRLGWSHSLLLVAGGLVTLVPLLCFAAAATRVPLSTVGLIQYLTPTVQFLLAVLVFGEQMSAGRWVGFGLVWVALMVLAGSTLLRLGADRRAQASRTPQSKCSESVRSRFSS